MNKKRYIANKLDDEVIDIKNLKIEFSNEIINKQYGLYDYNNIKNIIEKKGWEVDEKLIDETINSIKENGYKSFFDGEFQSIGKILGDFSKKIAEINKTETFGKLRELNDIFEFVGPKLDILGNFDSANKKIILYIKSIEKYAIENQISLDQVIEITFITELFNLFYYQHNPLNRFDYTSEVVKESLISFLAKMYCQYHKLENVSKCIWQLWNQYPTFNYPASGARYLVYDGDPFGTIEKVYKLSLKDMDQALMTLITNRNMNVISMIRDKDIEK